MPDDNPSADSPDEPDFITVDELALLLRCNPKTAYAAIDRGEIPGVLRLGRAIRIRRAALINWDGKERV